MLAIANNFPIWLQLAAFMAALKVLVGFLSQDKALFSHVHDWLLQVLLFFSCESPSLADNPWMMMKWTHVISRIVFELPYHNSSETNALSRVVSRTNWRLLLACSFFLNKFYPSLLAHLFGSMSTQAKIKVHYYTWSQVFFCREFTSSEHRAAFCSVEIPFVRLSYWTIPLRMVCGLSLWLATLTVSFFWPYGLPTTLLPRQKYIN